MCARRWPTDARRRLGSRKATTVLPEVPESTTREGADKPSPAHDEWPLDEALDETFPASGPIAPATQIRSTVGSCWLIIRPEKQRSPHGGPPGCRVSR